MVKNNDRDGSRFGLKLCGLQIKLVERLFLGLRIVLLRVDLCLKQLGNYRDARKVKSLELRSFWQCAEKHKVSKRQVVKSRGGFGHARGL